MLAGHGIELDRSTLVHWIGRTAWWLQPLYALLVRNRDGGAQGVLRRHAAAGVGSHAAAYTDDGCWAMPSMTGPGRGRRRPRWSTAMPRIAAAGTSKSISTGSPACCRSTATAATTTSRRPIAGRHDHARLLSGACAAGVLRRAQANARPDRRRRAAPDRRDLRHRSPHPRRHRRRNGSPCVRPRRKPLMAALWSGRRSGWQKFRPSRRLRAIRYTLGHWAGFTVFLADGRVEVDNNTVERNIRPIPLGRVKTPCSPVRPLAVNAGPCWRR